MKINMPNNDDNNNDSLDICTFFTRSKDALHSSISAAQTDTQTNRSKEVEVFWTCDKQFLSPVSVYVLVCWFGWFVCRITQEHLNRFPRNLDGGWFSAQNRPHSFLVQIQIKGIVLLCLTLPDTVFFQ